MGKRAMRNIRIKSEVKEEGGEITGAAGQRMRIGMRTAEAFRDTGDGGR